MLPILNLALAAIPRWVLLGLAVAFLSTSLALKVSNLNLQNEVLTHERRIAELKLGIEAANSAAVEQARGFAEKARAAEQARAAREKSLAAAAAGAKSELERLRVAVSKANGSFGLRAPADTLATGLDAAEGFPELFLRCSGRLVDVAREADIWKNDAVTLHEAWPR